MAISIDQLVGSTYAKAIAENKKTNNQWSEYWYKPTNYEYKMAISLAQIIDVAYPAILKELTKDGLFPSPKLNYLYHNENRIAAGPISKGYEAGLKIESLATPMTWTKLDEIKQDSESKKIGFVQAILDNGVDSHSYHLEQLLEDHKSIIIYSDRMYRLEEQNVYYQALVTRCIKTFFTRGPKIDD